jgi:hypothetical protein
VKFLFADKDLPVADRDYNFDVDLPDRPPGYLGRPFAEVMDTPYGGPQPILGPFKNEGDKYSVHVRYPLDLGDKSPNRKFGAVIASGWRAPVTGIKFVHMQVQFEQIVIKKRHNPACQADWNLWLNINGRWSNLADANDAWRSDHPNEKKPSGFSGVIDGVPIPLRKVVDLYLPDDASTPEARLNIQISGWVNFFDSLFGSANLMDTGVKFPQALSFLMTNQGAIGMFFKHFSRSDNFGVGHHCGGNCQDNAAGERSTAFKEVNSEKGEGVLHGDTDGDFAVFYHISRL